MEILLTDPTAISEPRNWIESRLAGLINDKRDLPVLTMQILTFFVMAIAACLVFVYFTWWTALIYFVLFVVFMGPHTITLHLMSHRKYFKQKFRWLDYPLLHGLGMLFGHTPRSYYSHHIGMHHVEGGLDPDASCTHHFRRDSIGGFARYLTRFLFVGFADLKKYLSYKKMEHLRRQVNIGSAIHTAVIIAFALVNWKATIVVFLVTVVYTRTIMMVGNWGQHSMVDEASPDNVYRNTITCINGFYNKWCFNDGYHISHHIHPTMHWTEHPKAFTKNIQKYADEDAIVLRTIDFFGVWLLLMLKRYNTLAKFYVHVGGRERTHAEIVSLLKQRTHKIEPA